MELIGYDFDNGLSEAYARFRADLHARDENWRRAARKDISADFDPQHAFYRRDGNRHRHFLARVGDRVLGHVSAFFSERLSRQLGVRVGCIGQFEFVEDRAASREAIAAACSWLEEICNVRQIWGPMNFEIWHEYRFKTRGFENRTFAHEPYNPEYYPSHFAEAGFRPLQAWHSFEGRLDGDLRAAHAKAVRRRSDFAAKGMRFDGLDFARLPEELAALHQLIQSALKDFLGFVPLSLEEFLESMAARRGNFDPELVVLARDAESRIAGFAIGFVDVPGDFRQGAEAPRGVCYLGGANPEFGRDIAGIGTAIFGELSERFRARGITTLVQAIVAEGNKSRGLFGASSPAPVSEYVLFEKDVR